MKRALTRHIRKGIQQRWNMDLPKEGGYLKDKYSGNSIGERLREKKTGSSSLLKKLPALDRHLSEKQKVVMKERTREFKESRTPYKDFTNKVVAKAISKAVSAGLQQDRWEQFLEDQANNEVPLEKKLHQVIARSGHSPGNDTSPFDHGKVTVNGKKIRDPCFLVTPRDEIIVDRIRILIDYPRLWRFYKPIGDPGKVVHRIDESVHYERGAIPGLPHFCYQASENLNKRASGLMLFTNDSHLAKYLKVSPDIERDWEVSVSGNIPQKLLRQLSTRFIFDKRVYTNMEWAITSTRTVSGQAHNASPNKVIATNLQVRTWGEGPNMVKLLHSLKRGVELKGDGQCHRTKIGPYTLSKLVTNRGVESYIDDGLFRFTDPTWQPWINFHAPLLQKGTFKRLQKFVNQKRSGPLGVESFEDELEEIREKKIETTRRRHTRSHTTAPTSPDNALAKVDSDEFRVRRRERVVGGMPATAHRSTSDILADMKKPDFITGIA
eukprot:TRINITY_DN16194_c0_g1_i1.p1 TRINITY_DN16194_c0_g1~~TRINITY_DN16194_c0_g1_i1.p1  ORF type:complete len:510 (+),score=73.13 TRINITY_DN16194_c0_g1_i1:50-1531(+)